jgi:hypothetical protein
MVSVLLLLLLATCWPPAGSHGADLRRVRGGEGCAGLFIVAAAAADMRPSAAVLSTSISLLQLLLLLLLLLKAVHICMMSKPGAWALHLPRLVALLVSTVATVAVAVSRRACALLQLLVLLYHAAAVKVLCQPTVGPTRR